jgi:hypothetical protein
MDFHKIWIEQCEAAQGIEDEFGVQQALKYLVGEKFLDFLEAAESNADFRAEIPAFVAKVREIFEPWQLAQYLETARETEPFDPDLFKPRWHPLFGEEKIEFDAEEVEEMRTAGADVGFRDPVRTLRDGRIVGTGRRRLQCDRRWTAADWDGGPPAVAADRRIHTGN